MRKSICTDLKIYLHGPPTFPSPHKYLALLNPRSNSNSVFHSAFAPRQRLPQRLRSLTTFSTAHGNHYIAWKPLCRIAIPIEIAIQLRQRFYSCDSDSIETAIHLKQRFIQAAVRCQMAMRYSSFYATWGGNYSIRCGRRCRGANALWKTLSEMQCRGTWGLLQPWTWIWDPGNVSDVVGREKVGVRANRFLGPCK